MRHDIERQWIGAIYAEDIGLVRDMLAEHSELANSLHCEFDDPFREIRYPVATLLFAVNGPPYQQLPWTAVERKVCIKLVETLLEHGADPNVVSIHGLPLCWARDRQVAQMLIRRGGDINRWHENGGFPLYFSLWQKDAERLRLQLSLGANPNQFSPDGGSPIHMAVDLDDTIEELKLEFLRLLLENGANPNLQCPVSVVARTDQNSPLHLAAARGSKDAVNLLLQFGADSAVRNRAGITPQEVVKLCKRPESIRRLFS